MQHEDKVSQRNGKPYTSCRLTVKDKQGKDQFISGFGSEISRSWNVGDTVDVDLSQNDKGYWNFDLNDNSKPSPNPVVALLTEIRDLLKLLAPNDKMQAVKANVEMQGIADSFGGEVVENIKVEDLDF